MGDLETLVSMGFDEERAALAAKNTGSLNDAITWLEVNQEKDIEEIRADISASASSEQPPDAGAEAKSYICEECGKKFRGMAQVEWHGNKSGHESFAESTEEIAPLTEEERKARLEELRANLAAKRAAQADEDKVQRKKNEEIRRKATKESQDIREQLQAKERLKEAEKKRREKKADQDARKKILDQIQHDKEERRRKAEAEKAARSGATMPQEPEAARPLQQPSGKKAADYAETRLRLQTPTGNVQKSFPVETTLFEVAHALGTEQGIEVQNFTQNFPKKTFDSTDFGMTLKEAGLVPSAVLIVRQRSG